MSEEIAYGSIERRVHGVFKGGGAKGIVYSAALHELRARGIWFKSVAGSSAGAITATMIAMGHDPQTLTAELNSALGSVKKNRLRWLLPGRERALYRTDRLERWIESQLRKFLHIADDAPAVTFGQLSALRPEIELNVVAMDLATKQPIVFNARTAPDCSVAAAVVASSAIPVAMRARRFLVRSDGATRVHRVVDGGAWANYPAFVYKDPSFRSFSGLEPMAPDDVVVGFVIDGLVASWQPGEPWPPPVADPRRLEDVRNADPMPSRFDLGSARRLGFAGALLSWSWLRLTLGLGVTVLTAVLLVRWWQQQIDGWSVRFVEDWPAWLAGPAMVATYGAIALTAALAAVLVYAQFRYVPEAIEVGAPSAVALMSVGPGVPAWVGDHPSDLVVRLSAPPHIDTTDFEPAQIYRELALVIAGHQAGAAMQRMFPQAPRAELPPAAALLGSAAPAASSVLQGLMPKAPEELTVDGGMSFFVGFYSLLAFFIIFIPGWTGAIAMMSLGAVFSGWLVRRAVNGRRINQSLHGDSDRLPTVQRWVGRLVFAVFIAGVALSFGLAWDDSLGRKGFDASTSALMLFLCGLFMIAAVGSLASVASRLSANAARLRYLREIGEGE